MDRLKDLNKCTKELPQIISQKLSQKTTKILKAIKKKPSCISIKNWQDDRNLHITSLITKKLTILKNLIVSLSTLLKK